MPCHAMHPIQDLFLESFSYILQIDMHFYMHTYVEIFFYSCKKWVLHYVYQLCLHHPIILMVILILLVWKI
jgi:hypothetical protein